MTEYRPDVQSIGHVLLWEPREFARLKVALENPLPEDATEHIKYQIDFGGSSAVLGSTFYSRLTHQFPYNLLLIQSPVSPSSIGNLTS